MRHQIFENRFGRYRIGRDNLEEYPELAQQLLGQTIIVRATMRYEWDAIEYWAYSPAFDICCPGCEPFYYTVVMTMSLEGDLVACRQPWEFRKTDLLDDLERRA